MNQQHERIGLNGIILGGFAVMGIAAVVGAALVFGALWALIGGVIALGVIGIALARIGVGLFSRWADAKVKIDGARYDFILGMASKGALPSGGEYIWKSQVMALPEPQRQEAEQKPAIDPRHMLLVNLCLLTIKSAAYGPTSHRLMSANDAQADRSGMFADRMNWDAASKYGQEQGVLYVQQGGKADEQGLKIKCGNGDTAADLLVVLHEKNLILDSAINALPGATR